MSNEQPTQETVDHATCLREELQLWIAMAERHDMLGIEGALRDMLEDANALIAEKTHLHDLWIAECGRTETLADDADRLQQQVDALRNELRLLHVVAHHFYLIVAREMPDTSKEILRQYGTDAQKLFGDD